MSDVPLLKREAEYEYTIGSGSWESFNYFLKDDVLECLKKFKSAKLLVLKGGVNIICYKCCKEVKAVYEVGKKHLCKYCWEDECFGVVKEESEENE